MRTGTWRRATGLALALAAGAGGACAAESTNAAPDAAELVRRSHDLLRDTNSYAVMSIEIVRPKWTRALTLEAWTRGTDEAFLRVLAPARDRGVTFLKRGREAWQYVPSIDRVIKIPPSMMLQSWMGSDFTNDDVVRADSLVTDYTHRLAGAETIRGQDCWLIESTPRPDAPVVWGRVRFAVAKESLVTYRIEYLDEDGACVKAAAVSDVSLVEGRELGTAYDMEDRTRPGHRTSIRYRRITFRPELAPDTFTEANLRRRS